MTAYKEGKQAFLDGNPCDSNPYQYGTPEYTYWFDGWVDAQRNKAP